MRQSAQEQKQQKQAGSSLTTELSAGRELSDVYLRHPANESSSDSEGEEVNAQGFILFFYSLD